MKLPRSAFLAIAAVTAADGRLTANEADGLLRAAKASGLDEEDLAAISAAAKDTTAGLDDLDLGDLDEWQEAVVYAISNWLARIDGIVNAQELSQLRLLADRLSLPKQKLERASAAAFDIAILPGGERPDKFDFGALELRLGEKLPSLIPPPPATK